MIVERIIKYCQIESMESESTRVAFFEVFMNIAPAQILYDKLMDKLIASQANNAQENFNTNCLNIVFTKYKNYKGIDRMPVTNFSIEEKLENITFSSGFLHSLISTNLISIWISNDNTAMKPAQDYFYEKYSTIPIPSSTFFQTQELIDILSKLLFDLSPINLYNFITKSQASENNIFTLIQSMLKLIEPSTVPIQKIFAFVALWNFKKKVRNPDNNQILIHCLEKFPELSNYQGQINHDDPSASKCSLLHLACSFYNEAVVKLLLENKASAELKTEHGDTPLHLAAASLPICEILERSKANLEAKNNDGEPPLLRAVHKKSISTIAWFLEKTAKHVLPTVSKINNNILHYVFLGGCSPDNDVLAILKILRTRFGLRLFDEFMHLKNNSGDSPTSLLLKYPNPLRNNIFSFLYENYTSNHTNPWYSNQIFDNFTPFAAAVKRGDLDLIKLMKLSKRDCEPFLETHEIFGTTDTIWHLCYLWGHRELLEYFQSDAFLKRDDVINVMANGLHWHDSLIHWFIEILASSPTTCQNQLSHEYETLFTKTLAMIDSVQEIKFAHDALSFAIDQFANSISGREPAFIVLIKGLCKYSASSLHPSSPEYSPLLNLNRISTNKGNLLTQAINAFSDNSQLLIPIAQALFNSGFYYCQPRFYSRGLNKWQSDHQLKVLERLLEQPKAITLPHIRYYLALAAQGFSKKSITEQPQIKFQCIPLLEDPSDSYAQWINQSSYYLLRLNISDRSFTLKNAWKLWAHLKQLSLNIPIGNMEAEGWDKLSAIGTIYYVLVRLYHQMVSWNCDKTQLLLLEREIIQCAENLIFFIGLANAIRKFGEKGVEITARGLLSKFSQYEKENLGSELRIPTGWAGHAIYVNLRRNTQNGKIIVIIDNLGEGLSTPGTHETKYTGTNLSVKSCVVGESEEEGIFLYLCSILTNPKASKTVRLPKIYVLKAYNNVSIPDNLRNHFTASNFMVSWQVKQQVGNCVLANLLVGMKRRAFDLLEKDAKIWLESFRSQVLNSLNVFPDITQYSDIEDDSAYIWKHKPSFTVKPWQRVNLDMLLSKNLKNTLGESLKHCYNDPNMEMFNTNWKYSHLAENRVPHSMICFFTTDKNFQTQQNTVEQEEFEESLELPQTVTQLSKRHEIKMLYEDMTKEKRFLKYIIVGHAGQGKTSSMLRICKTPAETIGSRFNWIIYIRYSDISIEDLPSKSEDLSNFSILFRIAKKYVFDKLVKKGNLEGSEINLLFYQWRQVDIAETLFIFDGFDERSLYQEETDTHISSSQFWTEMIIHVPNLIITTRPSYLKDLILPSCFKQKAKILYLSGLSKESSKLYCENFYSNSPLLGELIQFLFSSESLELLTSSPVLLSLFCFTWSNEYWRTVLLSTDSPISLTKSMFVMHLFGNCNDIEWLTAQKIQEKSFKFAALTELFLENILFLGSLAFNNLHDPSTRHLLFFNYSVVKNASLVAKARTNKPNNNNTLEHQISELASLVKHLSNELKFIQSFKIRNGHPEGTISFLNLQHQYFNAALYIVYFLEKYVDDTYTQTIIARFISDSAADKSLSTTWMYALQFSVLCNYNIAKCRIVSLLEEHYPNIEQIEDFESYFNKLDY